MDRTRPGVPGGTVADFYFLDSRSLVSMIFLILGYQILMILSDFGGPGRHFLMIFSYFGCLGTPFGGLGHILTQGSDFCDFGDLSATKVYLVFGSFFDTFRINFLVFFWVFVFLVFLWFRVPRGSILGSFLAPFWKPWALKRENEKVCLDCTGVRGLHIQPSGQMTFSIICGVFFKSALREASGTQFLRILSDFGFLEIAI